MSTSILLAHQGYCVGTCSVIPRWDTPDDKNQSGEAMDWPARIGALIAQVGILRRDFADHAHPADRHLRRAIANLHRAQRALALPPHQPDPEAAKSRTSDVRALTSLERLSTASQDEDAGPPHPAKVRRAAKRDGRLAAKKQ
ncbi:MAG: hypothetical protein WDA27_08795 [Actinomycetota bacterium]